MEEKENTHGKAVTDEKLQQLIAFELAAAGMKISMQEEWKAGAGDLPKAIDADAYYTRKLQILDDIIENVKKLQQATTPDEKAELEAVVESLLRAGGFLGR